MLASWLVHRLCFLAGARLATPYWCPQYPFEDMQAVLELRHSGYYLRLPERPLYHLAALGALLVLYGVLLFVPQSATTSDLLIWGIFPVAVFAAVVIPLVRRGVPCGATVVMLGLLGLALRLALGIYMYSRVVDCGEFGSVFVKDDRYFFEWAVQIISAPSITEAIQLAIRKNSTQIGPALFDAIPIALFGADPRNVVALASVVGGLTVVLTFHLALYFVPPRWALFAAFVVAVYPQQVFMAAAMQRDFVIILAYLIAGLSLLALRDRFCHRKSCAVAFFSLFLAICLVMAWRFVFGIALIAITFCFSFRTASRGRLKLMAFSLVGITLIVILGLRMIRKDILLALLDNPFLGFDAMRAGDLSQAELFGFLQGATGPARFFWLPLTFVLAAIFGFSPYRGNPNFDFVALGNIWFWLPLMVPMAIGARIVFARHRWSSFPLWSVPALVLLMAALTYQGMLPRYRSAAEPYMIILAVLGLRALGRWLIPYWIGVSAVLTLFLWHIWLGDVPSPSLLLSLSIIVSGSLCLLVMAVSGGEGILSFPRRRDLPQDRAFLSAGE